jgi:hypothetical protein
MYPFEGGKQKMNSFLLHPPFQNNWSYECPKSNNFKFVENISRSAIII